MKNFFLRNFDKLAARAAKTILRKKLDSYDLVEISILRASYESAIYYENHMMECLCFENDLELLTHAVTIAKRDGLFLEFGVATGRTIGHIAKICPYTIYGFDSFNGLPKNWRIGFPAGQFSRDTPQVPENVHLVTGLFSEALPEFVRDHSQPISLRHINCDLYSSTRTIFDFLEDQIQEGTVIVFDEYFNYPGWRRHEHKAFMEFVERRSLTYRCDSLVSSHQQVCAVILGPK